jgi:uncharacterized protein YjcR
VIFAAFVPFVISPLTLTLRHMTQNTPPKRTRGGQPGNQNALTHGFYSRKFKPAELNDLDTIEDTSGVEDEIKLLRIFMRRVSDQASTFTNLDQGMQFLRAMSIATYTLSRLIKMHGSMGGNSIDLILSRSMDDAIEAIRKERGWKI